MKKLLTLVILSLCTVSVAKADLTRKAERLLNQVRNKADVLRYEDRQELDYLLTQANQILRSYRGRRPVPGPAPTKNLMCDYSNGNLLINLNTGRTLHDFASSTDCTNALERVKSGRPFCDYSNGNIAYSSRFSKIFDFGSSTDCTNALPRIERGLNFCSYATGNTLHRPNGELIYDFSSSSDCTRALN